MREKISRKSPGADSLINLVIKILSLIKIKFLAKAFPTQMDYINHDNSSFMSSDINKNNCFYKLSAYGCSAKQKKAHYNELSTVQLNGRAMQVDMRDQLQEPSHEMYRDEPSEALSISGMLP